MKTREYIFSLMMVMILFQSSCKKNDLDDVNCSEVSSTYTSNVRPIINTKCVSAGCHDQGSQNGDYTSYSGIKVTADKGSLKVRVLDDRDMPLSGSLSFEELKKIKCWLDSGSPNN